MTNYSAETIHENKLLAQHLLESHPEILGDQAAWQKWHLTIVEDPARRFNRVFGKRWRSAIAWGRSKQQGRYLKWTRDVVHHFCGIPDWDVANLSNAVATFIGSHQEPGNSPEIELSEMQVEDLFSLQLIIAAQEMVHLQKGGRPEHWLSQLCYLNSIESEFRHPFEEKPIELLTILVELPLTLAFCLPELDEDFDWSTRALQRFVISLDRILDPRGIPHSHFFDRGMQLLAVWTRCRLLMTALHLSFDDEEADGRLDEFTRVAFRALRPDRTWLLTLDDSARASSALLNSAASYFESPRDRDLAQNWQRPKQRLNDSFLVDEIGYCSEIAEVAQLQDRIGADACRAAVRFGNRLCDFELSRGPVLLTSKMNPILTIDQQKVSQTSSWDVNVWFQDQDVDFLELEANFGPARIQRQFLLARDDRFFYWSDAVLLDEPTDVVYSIDWHVGSDFKIIQELETNEFYLTIDDKIRSLVLPVFCDEWRSKQSTESWQIREREFTIKQAFQGSAMLIPMLIDLKPKRSRSPRTWRRLTVAENLSPCSFNQATAHRVKIGNDQWLFYRSFKQPSNRTVMGQNYSCDFKAIQFQDNGESRELITVD